MVASHQGLNVMYYFCVNLTELVKKSKFYRNVIEDLSDNVDSHPVVEELKNFTQKQAEKQLMDSIFDALWDLLKSELTEIVELPLIVSRDPVSCALNFYTFFEDTATIVEYCYLYQTYTNTSYNTVTL